MTKISIEMEEEHVKFLTELAKEMMTQDRRGTADPYYYTIRTVSKLVAPVGMGDGDLVYFEPENWESFTSKADFIKSKLEDGYTQEEALKLAEDLEEYSQHKVEQNENFFLTKKGYDQHMRLNKHNYRHLHAYSSYVDYAHRNPELATLFEIIKSFAKEESWLLDMV